MINMKSNIYFKFISFFMVLAFIVFVIGSILSVKFIFIDPSSKGKVYGTVISVSDTETKVKYTVNNREYVKTHKYMNSSYYKGKKVKILYDKDNPSDSSVASSRFLWLLMPGISLVFLGITGVCLFLFYNKEYKNRI